MRFRLPLPLVLVLTGLVLLPACDPGVAPVDAATASDAAPTDTMPPRDAAPTDSAPPTDTGVDAFVSPVDAATTDAAPTPDAATPPDAFVTPDAGTCDGTCDAWDEVVCPADCWICTPSSSGPCYSGPTSTQGVGACHAGTHTCAADGLSYGACIDEVVPAVEACTTATDEDCDGHTEACGVARFATRVGASAVNDELFSVAVAPDGFVAIAGGAGRAAALDLGCGPLTAGGAGLNAFFAILDPSGACVVSRMLGTATTSGDSLVTRITFLPGGDVALGGYFNATLDFGGGQVLTHGASQDAFLGRVTRAGDTVWARRYASGSTAAWLGGLAADADQIVITGTMGAPIDLGSGPVSGAMYVAALAPADATPIYARGFAGNVQGWDLALDASGNAFVTGPLVGSTDFGGGTLTSAGSTDVVLVSLAPDGAHRWSRRFGDTSEQIGWALAVTPTGAVVVGGSCRGAIDLGGGMRTCVGTSDAFVARFTGDGTHVWSRTLATAAPGARVRGVAGTADDGVVLGVELFGAIDLGTGPLVTSGSSDVVLAHLDGAGTALWAARYGDAMRQAPQAIAASGSVVAVVGNLGGIVDFGTGMLTSAGAFDGFLAVLTP